MSMVKPTQLVLVELTCNQTRVPRARLPFLKDNSGGIGERTVALDVGGIEWGGVCVLRVAFISCGTIRCLHM